MARKPRTPAVITAGDQLGPLNAVATYLKVSRSYLSALKKCAKRRVEANPENKSPFVGNKVSAKWVLDWLDRNRDFISSHEYRKSPQSQG